MEEHLKASLVHLLQVGQEGFVVLPQDVCCPQIGVDKAIAVQQSRCLDDGMCSSLQITQRPAAADRCSAEALNPPWGLMSTDPSDVVCQSTGYPYLSCKMLCHAPRVYLLMCLGEPKVVSCTKYASCVSWRAGCILCYSLGPLFAWTMCSLDLATSYALCEEVESSGIPVVAPDVGADI